MSIQSSNNLRNSTMSSKRGLRSVFQCKNDTPINTITDVAEDRAKQPPLSQAGSLDYFTIMVEYIL